MTTFRLEQEMWLCRRCGQLSETLSADWEECPSCEREREEWEANTPEWVKLGMRGPWDHL
jgi:rubrerythrin